MAIKYKQGDEPVPGFRVVEFLGRGGFGEVWKAMAPGRAEVALKIIALDQKQGIKEFKSLRLVKTVRHPNLVPINAFWLIDSSGNLLDDEQIDAAAQGAIIPPENQVRSTLATAPFNRGRPAELIIAMGLGDMNLFSRLQECQSEGRDGIAPDELLEYMDGAAKAIDFLNSRHNIQHCDIKPQNIMIVGGLAQVCDFGLARELGDARMTGGAGTIAYGAPELLWDNKASAGTDQYSLAVTYYELRTGRLPFPEDSAQMAVMMAHRDGKLDLSALSEDERAVIKRATSPDPSKRFAQCSDMVRALRRAWGSASQLRPQTWVQKSGEGVAIIQIEPGSEIVPGYTLVKQLFRGGSSEVWEATAGNNIPRALLIRDVSRAAGSVDPDALALIQGMDHPHLTQVLNFWLLDDVGRIIPPETVSELGGGIPPSKLVIAGKLARSNLLERLEECRKNRESGIPPDELLEYMFGVASAVDELNAPKHQLGSRRVAVQHCNLRPVNMLLYEKNIVRIGNLARARVLDGPSLILPPSARDFEQPFCAPELVDGELTRSCDQYALAVSYVQMRTAHSAFDAAASTSGLVSHQRQGRLNLTGLGASEKLVIQRALARKAEERFENCGAMVMALEEALRTQFLGAEPAGSECCTLSHPIPMQPVSGVDATGDQPHPTAGWEPGAPTVDLARPVYLRDTGSVPRLPVSARKLAGDNNIFEHIVWVVVLCIFAGVIFFIGTHNWPAITKNPTKDPSVGETGSDKSTFGQGISKYFNSPSSWLVGSVVVATALFLGTLGKVLLLRSRTDDGEPVAQSRFKSRNHRRGDPRPLEAARAPPEPVEVMPRDGEKGVVLEPPLAPPPPAAIPDSARCSIPETPAATQSMVRAGLRSTLVSELGDLRLFGRYKVERLIGQGNSGAVYMCSAAGHTAPLAVKVFPGAMFGRAGAAERLLQTARVSAALDHPNLCRIVDAGADAGEFFIAMEYVEGSRLLSLLKKGPLDIQRAAALGRQLVNVLAYLAEKGVVHRDVKPDNLMVGASDQLKLLDLGLAKSLEQRRIDVTMAGQMLGTPGYMAPEQVTDARHVSPKSDLYGAGATLYHMVTGQLPFAADSLVELLLQVQSRPPPDPRLLRPDLPEPLAAIIIELLHKDPSQRSSHAKVLAVLEPFAGGDSLPAPAAKPPDASAAIRGTMMLRLDQVADDIRGSQAPQLADYLPLVDGARRLGAFVLDERADDGGPVSTYHAHHHLDGTRYIVRVLPPALEQMAPEALAEILAHQKRLIEISRDRRGLARLITIDRSSLTAGSYRTIYYLVEDICDGHSLAALVAGEQAQSCRKARWMLMQAAGALAALHRRGLVHGNLHPAKILVDIEHRRLRITDIGRARPVRDQPHDVAKVAFETLFHGAHGPLEFDSRRRQYVAPEMLFDGFPPCPKTDQYSLAVTVIESVTGRPISTHENDLKMLQLVRNDLEGRLFDIQDRDPRLADVLRRMAAGDRDRRFNDLWAVRDEIGPRPPIKRDRKSSPPKGPEPDKVYDVFISYRRRPSPEVALIIQSRLEKRGLRPFLDVTSLDRGRFGRTLLRTIETAPNFVVVLTRDCLKECVERQDWFRREIVHAIKTSRNIVPVLVPDFTMPVPHDLPAPLRSLTDYNGVPYSFDHIDGMIATLVSRLRTGRPPGNP